MTISQHQGKNIFISWLRFSGCPLCHLRVNELTNAEDKYGKDFTNVAIFSCNVDALKKTATKHGNSIIFAADEDRTYFNKYDMPQSMARVVLGITIRSSNWTCKMRNGFIQMKKSPRFQNSVLSIAEKQKRLNGN